MYNYYKLIVEIDTDMDFDVSFDLTYPNNFSITKEEGLINGSFDFGVHSMFHGSEEKAKKKAQQTMSKFIRSIVISDMPKSPKYFYKNRDSLADEVRGGDLTFKNILTGNFHFNVSFMYKSVKVL